MAQFKKNPYRKKSIIQKFNTMLSKNKLNLTNEEMSELIGGVASQGMTGDVVNKNSVEGCGCFYNNTPQVTNDPESTCTCVNHGCNYFNK